MAFFLLGRSEDGGLSLLSEASFESRQDAMAELGRMTADPSFDRWDDEVFLIDLDAATPVLLVRPAESVTPVVEVAEPDEPAEPAETVFAVIADEEPAVEADVLADEGADEETPEAQEAEPDAELGDEAEAPEPEESLEVPVDAPESDEASEETPASDETEQPDAADSDADAEMDSLRAAIARTTEHMEASGIVAPDSIGPAEVLVEESEEVLVEEFGETPAAADEEPARAESPEGEASGPEQPAWPWATAVPTEPSLTSDEEKPDIAYVLDGLEEPAIDAGGSLITASMDDEALAASRPVILGAYGEAAPLAETPDGDQGLNRDEVEAPAAEDAVPDVEPESDFIVLDDDPDAPAPTPAEEGLDAIPAPAPRAADGEDVLSLSSYVCDDCVYVDTCPNKDQRRPEDCGSFQWK
jgi:hypothetical protein